MQRESDRFKVTFTIDHVVQIKACLFPLSISYYIGSSESHADVFVYRTPSTVHYSASGQYTLLSNVND